VVVDRVKEHDEQRHSWSERRSAL